MEQKMGRKAQMNNTNPFSDNSLRNNDSKQLKDNKRAQVPRACSNCRRTHAGCGTERPCKRCIQHNLDCNDSPRKRRAPKQKGEGDEKESSDLSDGSTEIPEGNQLYQDIMETQASVSKGSYSFKDSLEQKPDKLNNSKVEYENQEEISKNNEIISNSPLISSMAPTENIGNPFHDPPETISSDYFASNRSSGYAEESSKDENRRLIQKIQNLEVQLWMVKNQQSFFGSQTDVSISTWLAKSDGNHLLVEFNERFRQMVGHSADFLMNNFTSSQFTSGSNAFDNLVYQRSTKIVTVDGQQEVFMNVHPINNSRNQAKYYVLHILQVQI
eukprot:TRINITY_DN4595_c0_g1_i1.p1 TRINITY_DN4595_c0_g1~~TRINITY_DN4595_c0_g1_i1.p1  ORF type:complete len:328 (-),score=82.44 TRINITY_DN4595_c0_g1_i1:227-1210(-)